ncbi:MAG: hypothetical protein QXX57_04270 [Nitrososphaerota archaeon]
MIVFGDIFLEDVQRFREQNLASMAFAGVFPLWGRDTWQLAEEFLKLRFKAVICCVDTQKAPAELMGLEYSWKLLRMLPNGVDLCGEKGEFHTFVYYGPIFTEPIQYKLGGENVLKQKRFMFIDILP